MSGGRFFLMSPQNFGNNGRWETRVMKEIRWGIIGCGDVTEIKSGPAFQICENIKRWTKTYS